MENRLRVKINWERGDKEPGILAKFKPLDAMETLEFVVQIVLSGERDGIAVTR